MGDIHETFPLFTPHLFPRGPRRESGSREYARKPGLPCGYVTQNAGPLCPPDIRVTRMTPQIVQMLAVLASRGPAYGKVYKRANGFMHARVHSHALPREQVHGPNRIVLKDVDSKSGS